MIRSTTGVSVVALLIVSARTGTDDDATETAPAEPSALVEVPTLAEITE